MHSATPRICRLPLTIAAAVVLFSCLAPLPCSAARSPLDLAQWCAFSVSPDGSKLAYAAPAYDRYGDPASELWVSKLDGSAKKLVTRMPGLWNVYWSDSSHLGCVRFDSLAASIIPVGKGQQRTVSLSDRFFWAYSSMSPNGKWLTSAGYLKESDEGGVYALDVASGKSKRLSDEEVKSVPAWSPDSKSIAYGIGGYQKDYKLVIRGVETGKVTDTGVKGIGAAWSPDGKSLAYVGNVVRGGSWAGGVPCDGSIMVMNLATKAVVAITEPGVNVNDDKTKRWEMSGSLQPQWSRDGKKIAYRWKHWIKEDRENSLDLDQIWVVNADGTDRKMLLEKWGAFTWAPDSKAILVRTANGIAKVSLESGKQAQVVGWKTPAPPKAAAATTIKTAGATVEFSGVKAEYAKAILTLAAEARRIYADQFHFSMPAVIHVKIGKNPDGRTQLWTDGEDHMFLAVTSNADLAPPMQSGVFNIYGVCHELGHIALYRNINLLGLPDGIGEGWAHYAGSVVVDEAYKKLGKGLWPDKYDYSEVEGLARLASSAKDSSASKDPTTKAALVFYNAHKRYGGNKVMAAMIDAEQGKPYGKDLMKRFADALVKLTGDESARALVPDEYLTPKVDWKVAERQITDKTVEGMEQVKDDTGVLLKYDDGSSESMRSTAGAGHAVVFKAPTGAWTLDYVQIYASRYGEPEPPKEDFHIFICDKDFDVLKDVARPYGTFENSDGPKWYKISFEPVPVSGGFYVCFFFNPTATKGVYVYYDKDVKISHSRTALPWSFVYDIADKDKYDWMIRAHLARSSH